MIKTGWYNTIELSLEQQKVFFKDAIPLCYDVHVESKYVRASNRTLEPDVSIEEALERVKELKIADRSVHHGNSTPYGEISMINADFINEKVDKLRGE